MSIKQYLFGLVLAVAFPFMVHAAGVQVLPSKIEAVVPAGQSRTYTITVANPTRDVQLFEIYPDALEDQISVNPKSFNLEAGERRTVEIMVTPKTVTDSSQAATTISVVARPLASGSVKAGTGIKLPITIMVGAAPAAQNMFQWWIGAVALIALVLIGYQLGSLKKKKKELADQFP